MTEKCGRGKQKYANGGKGRFNKEGEDNGTGKGKEEEVLGQCGGRR